MSWIKMRSELVRHPKVVELCRHLNCPLPTVLGALFLLWIVADEQSVDGRLKNYDAETIDNLCELPGFAIALTAPKVGWLRLGKRGAQVVAFAEHNSESAKQRAQSTVRVQRHRKPKGNGRGVTAALPDKRREEKITTPLPPKGGNAGGGKVVELEEAAKAVLVRIGVNESAWSTLPVDLMADTAIRVWLAIGRSATDRVAVLVKRLQSGERPERQPTPAAIAKAINDGIVHYINGTSAVGKVTQNSGGVFIDGVCILAKGDIRKAVFE